VTYEIWGWVWLLRWGRKRKWRQRGQCWRRVCGFIRLQERRYERIPDRSTAPWALPTYRQL